MKNEFNWPSSFRGEVFENVDGRTPDTGVTGMPSAQVNYKCFSRLIIA